MDPTSDQNQSLSHNTSESSKDSPKPPSGKSTCVSDEGSPENVLSELGLPGALNKTMHIDLSDRTMKVDLSALEAEGLNPDRTMALDHPEFLEEEENVQPDPQSKPRVRPQKNLLSKHHGVPPDPATPEHIKPPRPSESHTPAVARLVTEPHPASSSTTVLILPGKNPAADSSQMTSADGPRKQFTLKSGSLSKTQPSFAVNLPLPLFCIAGLLISIGFSQLLFPQILPPHPGPHPLRLLELPTVLYLAGDLLFASGLWLGLGFLVFRLFSMLGSSLESGVVLKVWTVILLPFAAFRASLLGFN